ncbi:LacI family DNA-binding transcriptional regulator [Victivallis sp. Marseille-Q1083]|uniref:LacI family DNA-binding transcriptional regulator n=1 Tax=Victivallis sp. Marseille-Q1083 TaxID=2717288 RepID=UPI00158A3F68|nr:LacI family DNA-binding transcriptional regulator [Victivallis sp. Marseille-Q1083]
MNKHSRNVTLKDIAQVLGLSANAISMGLNGTGQLAPQTRALIRETAKKMNYRPNSAARSLVLKKSMLIGAVLPYVNQSFFCKIVAGIESVAQEHGFALLLCNADGGREGEIRALEQAVWRKVDGIITFPTFDLAEIYSEIADEQKVPLVLLMSSLPGFRRDCVIVDNQLGGSQAAGHLLKLGHRHIGLIYHGNSPAFAERRQGFLDVCAATGAPVRGDHQRCTSSSPEDGESAALDLLTNYPEITAIAACSDYAAIGVLRAAFRLGRRVPEELSVIGYDDLDVAGMQAGHPLTTIAQPQTRIGQTGAGMLIRMIDGQPGEIVKLKTQLIERATTGVPPAAGRAG